MDVLISLLGQILQQYNFIPHNYDSLHYPS